MLCERSEFKGVSARNISKKIELFENAIGIVNAFKLRVVCLNCLFELDLWCEMQEMVCEMVSRQREVDYNS